MAGLELCLDQAGLELIGDPLASAYSVLALKMCTTMASLNSFVCVDFIIDV